MAMQRRYHDLVGREVVAASGRRLGRVADLEAERQGDDLRVVALLVGPLALFDRIWSVRTGSSRRRPHRVPWRDVARVERVIQLRVETLPQTAPAAGTKAGR